MPTRRQGFRDSAISIRNRKVKKGKWNSIKPGLSRCQMSRCLLSSAAYCKCLENMIKELTRPLLILVFTQCVMVKGSKGIQAWQYPLLITLQLHRARTASYDFRKSYFDLFEKENIKNTKSKILCSISNSIKLSFSLRWFWNILHFSVL